ncbi:ParA family protein [Fusobacterium sp. PH5-44]|uniref:ParA family protein n=1 Tax=unclassified Fusobacterium TaxID=2648384 RepID=UPI003D217A79
MGKTIMVKNNKGGVGKTFITCQLAFGMAFAFPEKNILMLTTDSQNDILEYTYDSVEIIDDNGNPIMAGLKAEVNNRGTGDSFKLMNNLKFIPLESESFATQFLEKIPKFLQDIKEEYDYIFIDSSPDLKIDEVFSKNVDYVIIPVLGNNVSLQRALRLAKRINSNKILGFILNMYNNTSTEKTYYDFMKDNIKLLGVIPELAFFKKMIDQRKTIWNYNNKDIKKIQMDLFKILLEIEKADDIVHEVKS